MALTVKFRGDTYDIDKKLKKLNADVGEFAGNVTAKFAKIGAAMAVGVAAFGAFKVGSFIADSSKAAASMEDLQMSFEVLTGSSKTAAAMIKTFREEAAKSPLSTDDYAQAGKTLLAFGVAADKVIPALRMLGDVSMGNSERFASLALVFAQTQSAGRLMGQDLLQYINAGFNPLQQISKKTGESMADLKKKMEEGGISAGDVAEAFKIATSQGGLFFGAIERGAGTFNGKVAAMEDAWQSLKVAFGTGMNEGLKPWLERIGSDISSVEGKFKTLGDNVGVLLAEALKGNSEIFGAMGRLAFENFKASFITGIDQIWGDIGTAVGRGLGKLAGKDTSKWQNESWDSTYGRWSDGIDEAQRGLDAAWNSARGTGPTSEDTLVRDRAFTDRLIDEVRQGRKTQEEMLKELRQRRPLVSK